MIILTAWDDLKKDEWHLKFCVTHILLYPILQFLLKNETYETKTYDLMKSGSGFFDRK